MTSVEKKYYLGVSEQGFHRLAYREWGKAGKKPTLICVHGVTRLAQDFDVLAKRLAKHYHVVCPDVAGRGDSDWLTNYRYYNFTQYCSDITALIARLNVDKVHFFGTSMGGIIGIILASLPNSPIRSLIVNDVGPEMVMSEIRRIGTYIGRAPNFHSRAEAEDFVRKTYSSFGNLTDKQWENMAGYSVRDTSEGLRVHYDPNIGKAFRSNYAFYTFTLWSYWEKISCPTMTLRGKESTFLTPSVAERMGEKGPNNILVEVEGAGHPPALLSTFEYTAIKNFLDSA